MILGEYFLSTWGTYRQAMGVANTMLLVNICLHLCFYLNRYTKPVAVLLQGESFEVLSAYAEIKLLQKTLQDIQEKAEHSSVESLWKRRRRPLSWVPL
jgi:hypothetical protein